MQAAETEVSEATRMATFTPGSDAARKAASKLEVPRIGVRFRLPAQMNNVQYFGRGPEENYIDRNHGTMVGIYQTTADKMYFNYVRPQENGHHTDTRWLNLSPDKGNRPCHRCRQPDRFQRTAQFRRGLRLGRSATPPLPME